MKKLIIVFLLLPIFILYSQDPDTIVVETHRAKGFGPFRKELLFLHTLSEGNHWIKAMPEIKGVPEGNSKMTLFIDQTDFLQHTYQSFYNTKISQEVFDECKKEWNWDPKPTEYTKDFVKLDIAFLACADSSGRLKVKIDKNNNYDLSDDDWYYIPAKIPGQNFWGRYNDLLPFEEAEYEYYDGNEIKKNKTWIYVDYSPMMYNKKSIENEPLELSYAFAEHHIGEFIFNNEKYSLALKGGRAAIRNDYKIKIWKTSDIENSEFDEGVAENELVLLKDIYYKVKKACVDGSKVTLVKDSDVETTGGNQVGMKAPLFNIKSIDGESIDLNSMKGKYVLLDFWGTWCGPCKGEIPKLKEIYEKYSNKNFIMIGIANDKMDALQTFIKTNDIKWKQIIQETDKNIIRLFKVKEYPTTFLINQEGRIIEKGIRGDELDSKLKKIFEH